MKPGEFKTVTKVIVTDADKRKSLAAIRNLGKKGYYVIAGSNKKINLSRMSKYCNEFLLYPDPTEETNRFIEFMINYLTENKVDVLLAMEDMTVGLFSKNFDSFSSLVRLPIPKYDIFLLARDKEKTLQKALLSGVLCPKTYFINDLKKLEELQDDISYPIVIKPKISSGSRGIRYINSKEKLYSNYIEVHKEFPYPMLQEFIPQTGRKFQVLLLINEKKDIKASCTQEFIRQFPVNGGPGTLWKTIKYPELEEISGRFLKDINWYGIACVEYITDPRTNEPMLMEVNPRFWGTLSLSIEVGVDFPYLLTKQSLGEEFDPVFNKRYEEYCQWLLPGDILNFLFNRNRFNQEIGYFFNKPRNFYYAIISKDDWMPIIGEVMRLCFESFTIRIFSDIFKRGK